MDLAWVVIIACLIYFSYSSCSNKVRKLEREMKQAKKEIQRN